MVLELTPEQEQKILEEIPDPKDLEELLNKENTKRNGEGRRIALSLLEKEIGDFLIGNKESILRGETVRFELKLGVMHKYSDDMLAESLQPDIPREVAEEIQRILVEKTYVVSCEAKQSHHGQPQLWDIIIQRAPSLR